MSSSEPPAAAATAAAADSEGGGGGATKSKNEDQGKVQTIDKLLRRLVTKQFPKIDR